MKKTFLFVAFFFVLHHLLAQTAFTVSGAIKDTTGREIIAATIRLITGKDTLRTTCNEKGKFSFSKVPQPVFTLCVSALGYETWCKGFVFPETGAEINLVPITLFVKASTLKEVVVKGKFPKVIIKEDTIEYRVDQYKLRENSVVEDLLKRLPGLQVDMDGNVTYMGKGIAKVRINGKDFLVDNIKSLTRLLPIDLIDNVQLIDDYGDMARATGRKEGEPERVLNLQTKKDLNNIYQAQGIVGGGNDNRYTAGVLANYFSERNQLSIIGNTNNTSAQIGNVITTTGSINYRGKFNKALSMNAGLQGGRNKDNLQSYSTVKNETSNGILYSTNSSNNSNLNNNYSFTGGAEYKPKEGDMINFNLNGSLSNTINNSELTAIQSGFQRKDQVAINGITNRVPVFTGTINASHRFNRLGRTLSQILMVSHTNNNNSQDGSDSLRYYNIDNTIAKDSLLHQLIYKTNNNLLSNSQTSWVESLDSFSSLQLRYAITYSITDNSLATQWIDPAGKKTLIDSLSNSFTYKMVQHEIGLNYRRNKGKLDYTIGLLLQPASLQANLVGEEKHTVVHSKSLVPVLRVQYKLSRATFFTLAYMGSVGFPTYQQLQTIPDLTNTQFPIIGNPNLRTSLSHNLTSSYRNASINNTWFLQFSAKYTQNKVVTNVVLVKDSFNTVKQETHFLNANGYYNLRFDYSWTQQLQEGKYNLFLEGANSYNNNVLYMDNIRKTSNNLVLTQLGKANMMLEWLELTGNISYTYNRNVYILRENNITNIHTWTFGLSGKIYFLKTFALAADASKQVNNGYSGAVSINPLMINGTLEKMFFRRTLTCRLQGFNLLDETSRLSQIISGNSIIENRNKTLGRYFMLSLQCDLRMFKGK
jgi:hypothetical protein